MCSGPNVSGDRRKVTGEVLDGHEVRPRGTLGIISTLEFFEHPPVIGAVQSPARAIYPPTAIAPLVPMLRAPEAVPWIVFTNRAVSSTSIANAFPLPMPLPSTVAPSAPIMPNMARRKSVAKTPPTACAKT